MVDRNETHTVLSTIFWYSCLQGAICAIFCASIPQSTSIVEILSLPLAFFIIECFLFPLHAGKIIERKTLLGNTHVLENTRILLFGIGVGFFLLPFKSEIAQEWFIVPISIALYGGYGIWRDLQAHRLMQSARNADHPAKEGL
jgi:hypothetical protein